MIKTNNHKKREIMMTLSARKLTTAISFALLSAGNISTSHAAGFALIENSASGQGNAYAGAAAVAEDASTVWFNPAGMMKLSGNQMVLLQPLNFSDRLRPNPAGLR